MSELIQKHDNRATIRWKLLTGVSALALTTYVASADIAKAEDSSQPQIWIELHSQFARQQAGNEAFLPPFLFASQFDGVSEIARTPKSVWNDGAKISFQPTGSDWLFSAAISIGRISHHASQNQVTAHPTKPKYVNYAAYQDFRTRSSESHAILDFQAGKDVGLGKFGSAGSSVLSAGVRYVHFKSQSNSTVQSQPTNAISYARPSGINKFHESFSEARKFSGVGPSLSWNASAGIAGNSSTSSITLDWGVNGALLFGRQRAKGSHEVQEKHFAIIRSSYPTHRSISVVYQTSASPARSKSVTVPNFGGFAAVSWRYANAKISLGYRADMFFGAIDGGLATRKTENRSFYGPFASISIGLGD